MEVIIKNLGKFKLSTSKLDNFFGLRFKKKLQNKEGVILFNSKESRFGMAADMFFVFFSLDMAFLNSEKKIVDIRRNVKPFTPIIYPEKSSKYLVEMNSGEMEKLKVGDKLTF